jgi:hypothetical protein
MPSNLSFEQLKIEAASGDIDTVLVCIVDQQGFVLCRNSL